jgi:hypothetical protein
MNSQAEGERDGGKGQHFISLLERLGFGHFVRHPVTWGLGIRITLRKFCAGMKMGQTQEPWWQKTHLSEPGIQAHACNSSPQEAKAGRSRVQGQPVLHNKTPFQKNKKKDSSPSCTVVPGLRFIFSLCCDTGMSKVETDRISVFPVLARTINKFLFHLHMCMSRVQTRARPYDQELRNQDAF